MKRYKLVRVVDGRFFSANTPQYTGMMLEYIVGSITGAADKGIACYKKLRNANTFGNIHETMHAFNEGNPIAVLEVEPIGKHIPRVSIQYGKGGCYEGGINYPAVKVIRVVAEINQQTFGNI